MRYRGVGFADHERYFCTETRFNHAVTIAVGAFATVSIQRGGGGLIKLHRDGPVFILTMDEGENRMNQTWLDAVNAALDEVDAGSDPVEGRFAFFRGIFNKQPQPHRPFREHPLLEVPQPLRFESLLQKP